MQVAYGHGIANYFNDGGNDLAPDGNGNAEALPILGLLLYYDHYWDAKWTVRSATAKRRRTIPADKLANAYSKGQYMSANLLHYPAKNILVGGELLLG